MELEVTSLSGTAQNYIRNGMVNMGSIEVVLAHEMIGFVRVQGLDQESGT